MKIYKNDNKLTVIETNDIPVTNVGLKIYFINFLTPPLTLEVSKII